jgi:acetyl-CoA carboxylase beta subunit
LEIERNNTNTAIKWKYEKIAALDRERTLADTTPQPSLSTQRTEGLQAQIIEHEAEIERPKKANMNSEAAILTGQAKLKETKAALAIAVDWNL